MNSLSNKNNENGYEHHRKCINNCPPQYCDCDVQEDLHPVPGSALLEIGKGYPILVNNTVITSAAPVLIAQVTLDPTCFCFPNLKIEFSSLVTLTGAFAATDSITIKLSRIRYGYPGAVIKEPLQSYTVPNLNSLTNAISFSWPFGFIYGEENIKLKESTYVIEITSATIATVGTTIQFSNVNIVALAVGGVRTA